MSSLNLLLFVALLCISSFGGLSSAANVAVVANTYAVSVNATGNMAQVAVGANALASDGDQLLVEIPLQAFAAGGPQLTGSFDVQWMGVPLGLNLGFTASGSGRYVMRVVVTRVSRSDAMVYALFDGAGATQVATKDVHGLDYTLPTTFIAKYARSYGHGAVIQPFLVMQIFQQ